MFLFCWEQIRLHATNSSITNTTTISTINTTINCTSKLKPPILKRNGAQTKSTNYAHRTRPCRASSQSPSPGLFLSLGLPREPGIPTSSRSMK